MSEEFRSIVHPATRRVEVKGGAAWVEVSPWTMAQRASLKPRIVALIDRVQASPTDSSDLGSLFAVAEDEVVEIVRASVKLPEGLAWDDLLWEDLPVLAQAIWETCVARADGGGLLGKLPSVLLAAARDASTRPKPSDLSSTASPSSPPAGEPSPTPSAIL